MNNAIIGKSQTKSRHGGYKAIYTTNDKPRPGKKKYQALGERVTSSDKKRKEVSSLELETVEM